MIANFLKISEKYDLPEDVSVRSELLKPISLDSFNTTKIQNQIESLQDITIRKERFERQRARILAAAERLPKEVAQEITYLIESNPETIKVSMLADYLQDNTPSNLSTFSLSSFLNLGRLKNSIQKSTALMGDFGNMNLDVVSL